MAKVICEKQRDWTCERIETVVVASWRKRVKDSDFAANADSGER